MKKLSIIFALSICLLPICQSFAVTDPYAADTTQTAPPATPTEATTADIGAMTATEQTETTGEGGTDVSQTTDIETDIDTTQPDTDVDISQTQTGTSMEGEMGTQTEPTPEPI